MKDNVRFGSLNETCNEGHAKDENAKKDSLCLDEEYVHNYTFSVDSQI